MDDDGGGLWESVAGEIRECFVVPRREIGALEREGARWRPAAGVSAR